MYSFQKILARSQTVLGYATAIATTIALAGSIDVVRADPSNN